MTSINFTKQKIDKSKANHAAAVFKGEKDLVIKRMENTLRHHATPTDFYESMHTRLICHATQKMTYDKLQELFATSQEHLSPLHQKEHLIALMNLYDRCMTQKKNVLGREDMTLLVEQKKALPE